MATGTITLSANWKHAATGPGDATFEFQDEPGEWIVYSAASCPLTVAGMKAEREKPVSIALEAGEYLHLRGRGAAVVVATTLAA